MADVTINSGPVEAEDKLRYVPRDKWRELMLARRRFLEVQLSYDCRCLVQFVNDAQEMYAELGFANPDAMILDGYGLEPKEIGVAVEWLTLNPPKEPISLERVTVLARHGTNQHTRGDSITTSSIGRGRGYVLARLDRDHHHELAAEVRAGTISANAVAKQLEWRKPPSPLKQLRKAWKAATPEQRAEFLAEISAEIPERSQRGAA